MPTQSSQKMMKDSNFWTNLGNGFCTGGQSNWTTQNHPSWETVHFQMTHPVPLVKLQKEFRPWSGENNLLLGFSLLFFFFLAKGKSLTILFFVRYLLGEINCQPRPRYVLTRRLQSDPLERRYGKYRRLCGTNYNISVQQVSLLRLH